MISVVSSAKWLLPIAWQQNSFQQEVSTQRIHIIHMIICISSASLTHVLVLQTLLHVSSMVSRPSCDFLRTCSIQEPDTPKPFRSASSACLSVHLSIHLLVCSVVSACVLDVCLSVCLSVHTSACLSICSYNLLVCLSVCASVYLCICLCPCACVRLSICAPASVSACLSVCLWRVRQAILPHSRLYQHESIQLAWLAFQYMQTHIYSQGSRLTTHAWMSCRTLLMNHTKIVYWCWNLQMLSTFHICCWHP